MGGVSKIARPRQLQQFQLTAFRALPYGGSIPHYSTLLAHRIVFRRITSAVLGRMQLIGRYMA